MTNYRLLPQIPAKVKNALKKYPAIIQQLLFNRDIEMAKEAEKFLNPSLSDLHDPTLIYGIDKAVDRILEAVEKKEKMVIHGDFDVDGVTASAILWDYLYRKLGADAIPYIPHRVDEGYGMTEKSLTTILKKGGELVVTVDCGIRDIELVEKFKKKGLDFVVTDHHEFEKQEGKIVLPACPVVHPRHPKGRYPFGLLSGAAIAWKLVEYIAKVKILRLGSGRVKVKSKRGTVTLPEYLDLVALSTECDVVLLVDENRIILKHGIDQIRKAKRPGIRNLILDSGYDFDQIEAYHLGFVLGPRLNASGRLGHAIDAVRLLSTKSEKNASILARKLSNLNRERQKLTEEVLEKAKERIESLGFDKKVFIAWGEEWPEGIVGLVAGKLSEEYNRPTIIAARNGENFKASCRSIPQFNIIEAISQNSDILIRYGGHAQAAGFEIHENKIGVFQENVLKHADEILTDNDLKKELPVDLELDLSGVNMKLLDWLEKFKPFGYGNRTPIFLSKKLKVKGIRGVGDEGKHLKLLFSKGGNGVIGGIGFGLGEKIEEINVGDEVDVVYNLDVNEWNGERRVDMKVKEIVKSPSTSSGQAKSKK